MSLRPAILVAFAATLGCTESGKDGAGDSGGATTGPGTDSGGGPDIPDTADTGSPTDTADPPPVMVTAKINGAVRLEPMWNIDGEPVPVDENELESAWYPYGAIFVAVQDATTGAYVGDQTISFPDFHDNSFELTVEVEEGHPVRVFAALDDDGNGILSSNEPIGVWPAELAVEDGGTVEDVEISIVAAYPPEGTTTDTTNPDGTPCDLTISGDVTVGTDFEGRGLAMVLEVYGHGPTTWSWFTVADGASTYSLTTCAHAGAKQLIGAIDTNENTLIDPTDTFGTYVTSPDTDGNPIAIESADLQDYTLQIPLLDDSGSSTVPGIALVPFVRLSGTVAYDGGTFDDLDPGTRIVVAALKVRANSSVSLASIESQAFDVQVFDWADLQGQATIDYQLMVPGNADLFLWAYADPDLDGTLNEVGEPVASAFNSASGLVSTGAADHRIDMLMGIP